MTKTRSQPGAINKQTKQQEEQNRQLQAQLRQYLRLSHPPHPNPNRNLYPTVAKKTVRSTFASEDADTGPNHHTSTSLSIVSRCARMILPTALVCLIHYSIVCKQKR